MATQQKQGKMALISKSGDFVSILFPESTAGQPLGYILNILQNAPPTLRIVRGGMLDALHNDDTDDTWFVVALLFGPSTPDGAWSSLKCSPDSLVQVAFHANHQRPFSILLTKKLYLATNSYVGFAKPDQTYVCGGGNLYLADTTQQDGKGDRIVQIDGTLVTVSVSCTWSRFNGQLMVCTRRTSAVSTLKAAEPAADDKRDMFQRVDDWVAATLTQIGVL